MTDRTDPADHYITDGFGQFWPAACPDCGAPMQVIRPGVARCSAECHASNDQSDPGDETP